MKICYFTSKNYFDIRVFWKECTSLAKAGYDVYLVSPNATDEVKNGVHIIGVPFELKGEYNRLFVLPRLLYEKGLEIDADIYHFNDPNALKYGVKLKKHGKKVVFDSFEDHPTLLLEHKNIPYWIRIIVSRFYSIYEYNKCKQFDGLIFCYHWTQDRLKKACQNNQLIFNFPILSDKIIDNGKVIPSICYAGLLSKIWNIENIVKALGKTKNNVKLNLAGHGNEAYMKSIENLQEWNNVNYLGMLKQEEVLPKVYSASTIGVALLDYIPLCKGNVGNMSNNKLFEYLMAGIPVICTDFILWKEVVEKNNCGICVNPQDSHAIAKAIDYLIDNPDIAKQMGANGRKVVERMYNWKQEESKLLNIYKNIQ